MASSRATNGTSKATSLILPTLAGSLASPDGTHLRYEVQRIFLILRADKRVVQCGSCYALTYQGKTINILAIDHTDNGFNIAEAALNDLTGGHAVEFGRVNAQYVQVDLKNCKI